MARANGYRGIWFTLGQFSEYGDKYSGGLGTYTAKHVPMAVHAPRAGKTFFVYGGCPRGERRLLAMAGCYDHATGLVPRPTVVHDKGEVNDPHDNPTLCLDGDGYVWVFVSGRGRVRPGHKYRSHDPYSIDAFERVGEEEMAYPQPWWIADRGFLHLFTKYTGVRELYWNTSPDGRRWSPHRKLAGMGGHYQTSRRLGRRVVTAFNMHPDGDVDRRTNLYYAETSDLGEAWTTAGGEDLRPPLIDPVCAALVRDYRREGRLVYLKDLTFDPAGQPVILYVTSAGHRPGPKGDPRIWTVARWTGEEWAFHDVTRSTHNYDTGCLDASGAVWTIIGPTEPGPQHWGTGGEMALWQSADQGATWARRRRLTVGSRYNHSYARRPIDAHHDFCAFWSDGHADEPSDCRLYFCDRKGNVRVLPETMASEFAEPSRLR
jgi:hypothetical protein